MARWISRVLSQRYHADIDLEGSVRRRASVKLPNFAPHSSIARDVHIFVTLCPRLVRRDPTVLLCGGVNLREFNSCVSGVLNYETPRLVPTTLYTSSIAVSSDAWRLGVRSRCCHVEVQFEKCRWYFSTVTLVFHPCRARTSAVASPFSCRSEKVRITHNTSQVPEVAVKAQTRNTSECLSIS